MNAAGKVRQRDAIFEFEVIDEGARSGRAEEVDTVKPGELKFHHMCVWTDDIDADTEYYTSLGYEAANLAKAGDLRFAYYDTNPLMGCMIEVLERNDAAAMMFARIKELGNSWDGNDPYRTVDQLFG